MNISVCCCCFIIVCLSTHFEWFLRRFTETDYDDGLVWPLQQVLVNASDFFFPRLFDSADAQTYFSRARVHERVFYAKPQYLENSYWFR